MLDLTTFTDTELADLTRAIPHEWDRREALPAMDRGRAEVVAGLRDAGTLPSPEVPEDPTEPGDYPAWVDPGTDHANMHLAGDLVAHDGSVWRSEHNGLNHWEPGTVGVDWRIWRDITNELFPDDEPVDPPVAPEWDGQGHDYATGDLVAFEGTVYRVVSVHTSQPTWYPNTLPSLYTPVEAGE